MARLKGSPNWSIEQKAEAVAILHTEAGGCLREAERLTDISRLTIAQAAQNAQIARIAEVKKSDLAAGFNSLLYKLLQRYEKQVDDADLTNKGTTLLGIIADKALLYNDQPNQITQSLAPEQVKSRILELVAGKEGVYEAREEAK